MGKQREGVMREVREGRVGELRLPGTPPQDLRANSSSGHSWSVMSSAWHSLVACTPVRWLNSDQPREKPPSWPPMAPYSPSPHPALPTFQPFIVTPGNSAAQDQTPPRRGRGPGRSPGWASREAEERGKKAGRQETSNKGWGSQVERGSKGRVGELGAPTCLVGTRSAELSSRPLGVEGLPHSPQEQQTKHWVW